MLKTATTFILFGILLVTFGQPCAEGITQGGNQTSYSPAEKLLWLSDHFANIDRPTKLRYEFKKIGSLEEGFTDIVELHILNVHEDGMKDVRVNFLTGQRHHYVPPQERISGNPILGIYLQGDVYEMNRLADGGWPYFHRQIKFAFAEAAEVRPITFNFNGRVIEGATIEIAPYLRDPKRNLFEKFADKTYEFILSNQIPGTLYQIRTVVLNKSKLDPVSSEPLIEEILTFVEAVEF